jgi:Lipoxygenase
MSDFDTKGFEPIIPVKRNLDEKKIYYQWSDPTKDGYPPHLNIGLKDQNIDGIFDRSTQVYVSTIIQLFSFMIPHSIEVKGTPFEGPTIADCEKYNRDHPGSPTDIMGGKNIGNLTDWYSDSKFAQQHLSGVNPSTIETASQKWVKAYVEEAGKQKLEKTKKLLSEGKDLFVQDYSYFREATGVSNEEEFKNTIEEKDENGKPNNTFTYRYACASVVIFQLHGDGRLHPLAITLDYRGSLDKSVTLFNRRLKPDDKVDEKNVKVDEKNDWPWRYAKTCVQTADWARHELAVHLVDTHLIEEAVIVATNRTIPDDHILYDILSPHWFRTLPLNAAARELLVPGVIARLCGLGPPAKAFSLVRWSYKNFNFQEKYIPNDLKKRGFQNLKPEDPKYRNYPYAHCMTYLWGIIRDFVKSVLKTKYTCNKEILEDPYLADWYKEIQTKGQVNNFPTIKTVDELIDAVTMCIHIASPQHTAVNYLQDYYYSFVPSKPAALCTRLPANLNALKAYTEKDLTAALPIGPEGPKWKDWLLASQLPILLSYRVDKEHSLINYSKSVYNVNRDRTGQETKVLKSDVIREAAKGLYSRLKTCDAIFKKFSDNQTAGTIEYKVLQSEVTAVSILI